MILTGGRFFSTLKSFRSIPLLLVSSLTTNASTCPLITAGPKSFSSLLISYDEFGKFFSITDSKNFDLVEYLFASCFPFFAANSLLVRPIITLEIYSQSTEKNYV